MDICSLSNLLGQSSVATSIASTPQSPEPRSISTTTLPDRDAIIARAIAQVEAALDLPQGSVTVSGKAAPLPDGEVFLSTGGEGEASLDLDIGHVVYLIPGAHDPDSDVRLTTEELDEKATRLAEAMGWDVAALAAEGFTVEEAKLIDHGRAYRVHQALARPRRAGHTEQRHDRRGRRREHRRGGCTSSTISVRGLRWMIGHYR